MNPLRSIMYLLCLSLILAPASVFATLGGDAGSVAKDRSALAGVRRAATTRSAYTVEEMSYEGTTVREYLNSAGIVFAVAWNGHLHADLDQILGSYAAEYRSARAQQTRSHGRKRQKLSTANLVLETWGHMRALQGRAYLPALIPDGVTIDEIK